MRKKVGFVKFFAVYNSVFCSPITIIGEQNLKFLSEGKTVNFDRVVTVKKEHTKEEFLRAAIIKLASDLKTPVDVVKADFGEVKESVKEAILCVAQVESDYSASVGYDREEEYRTTDRKQLSAGDWYTRDGVRKRADYSGSYTVDVIKTRTVTDWQPYNGHIGGEAVCAAMNGEEEYGESRLVDVIKSVKEENIEEKGEATVSAYGLKDVKNNCRRVVERRIDFPGDHMKDFHSNATVQVNVLECWKLPYYEVEYTYKGEKYKASDYACGDLKVEAECPPDDTDIVVAASNDTKGYRAGMAIGWSLFGILFVLSCIMIAVGKYSVWIAAAVSLVVAIVLHVVGDKKYFARVRDLTENKVVLKRNELEGVLSQKGYEELTSSEESLFNAKERGDINAYVNRRNGVKVPAILCSIATVILIIVSSIMGANAKNKALHSPEQFTVAITSKTQEYKENASPYTNGCYYIYLEFDVTSREIGAKNMRLETTIYDKSGKEIGALKTSLSDMNIGANSKKRYSTYLENNQPERDNSKLFITLYKTRYSELSFKTEIMSIDFSDGKYWKNEKYI